MKTNTLLQRNIYFNLQEQSEKSVFRNNKKHIRHLQINYCGLLKPKHLVIIGK